MNIRKKCLSEIQWKTFSTHNTGTKTETTLLQIALTKIKLSQSAKRASEKSGASAASILYSGSLGFFAFFIFYLKSYRKKIMRLSILNWSCHFKDLVANRKIAVAHCTTKVTKRSSWKPDKQRSNEKPVVTKHICYDHFFHLEIIFTIKLLRCIFSG